MMHHFNRYSKAIYLNICMLMENLTIACGNEKTKKKGKSSILRIVCVCSPWCVVVWLGAAGQHHQLLPDYIDHDASDTAHSNTWIILSRTYTPRNTHKTEGKLRVKHTIMNIMTTMVDIASILLALGMMNMVNQYSNKRMALEQQKQSLQLTLSVREQRKLCVPVCSQESVQTAIAIYGQITVVHHSPTYVHHTNAQETQNVHRITSYFNSIVLTGRKLIAKRLVIVYIERKCV